MTNQQKFALNGLLFVLVIGGAAVWAILIGGLVGFDWGLRTLILGLIINLTHFTPSFVAVDRKHHNAVAIIALNLIFGWTLIGWGIAFVWAFMEPEA